VELQVLFLTDWISISNRNLKYEVEFMVVDIVFDKAVLKSADETSDLGFGTKFFGKLTDERLFSALARLNMSAGQE